MRRGVTLLELMVVLVILGIVSAFAVPRLRGTLDRLAVARAASEVASFYGRARMAAIFRSSTVRIEFRADTLNAILEGLRDEVAIAEPGPARHGVSLDATRDMIRLYPTGFGIGGANTRLIVARGVAAETLTTSRLGRLKRW
jgi:prepilin-type N-terminal cleavage/methylation domain-containing protein